MIVNGWTKLQKGIIMIMVDDYKTPSGRMIKVVEGTKSAVITAAATTGFSVGTVLDWIPDGVGKLGALVGVILSVVLIIIHIRRHKLDVVKADLEAELLRLQIKNERRESDSCNSSQR